MNNTKQKVLPLYRLKSILVILTIITVFLSNIDSNLMKITLLDIKLYNWIIAFTYNVFIAFVLHYVVFRLTTKKIVNFKLKSFRGYLSFQKDRHKIFLLFFSSDYVFASQFKSILDESIEETCPKRKVPDKPHKYNDDIFCNNYECETHLKKKSRKLFILLSNWSNVIIVCLLVLITVLIEQGQYKNLFKETPYFAFLLLHTLSRGIEIVYAFYKDVVSSRMNSELEIDEKLSNLKRGNRISLAVHSYLEMALIFGIIYFIQPATSKLSEGGSLLDSILYSFSVMAFNFSFDKSFITLGGVLHVTQVFIGITLVVLSIANYLGMKDTMSEFEKSDWRNGKYI